MKKKIAITRSFGCLVTVVIFMSMMHVSICASDDLVLTRADYNMGIAVEDTRHIGRYTEATYDGTMLLDDYPNAGSSYTTIQIDGYDYCQDAIMDPYVLQKPTKIGDSIVTKWVLAPYVTVSQNITLMQNTTQYQLAVANIGYASHSVKVRALFDVALGDSDDVLCWVPVAGEITTEREFKDIDYWRTKSSHDRSSLTLNCTFAPDNRPDKVLFASWDDINNASFDYMISEGLDITSDTAVAMYWDLGILASGETKEVTFYFGIESRPIILPPLDEAVKSNCETCSIDQIMAGAKLIEKVQTNAIVNLNGIIYDFNATLQGDYAVWEEELDDYIYKGDTYHGVAGYNKSPVIVRIAVSKDGLFLLGTFNGTAEDNLVIFAQNRGLTNYRDFMGNLLDKSQYGVPHDVFLDLDARQNILAYIFGEVYKHLYNKGCIWSCPKDYNELYNCDYTLENRFDLPISVIRLYPLLDQRKDWRNEKYRPIREARNAKWSPSGNKPNQNYFLSRNFNVNYQNVNGSFVWMQTHTDMNRLQSEVTIYRMNKPPDYSCRGGGDSRSWQVKYDLYAESYTVHNDGCAVAELFLCDQPPNRVQMEVYTPCLQFLPAEKITVPGNIEQSVTIAVFGYITTSNSLKYICNAS